MLNIAIVLCLILFASATNGAYSNDEYINLKNTTYNNLDHFTRALADRYDLAIERSKKVLLTFQDHEKRVTNNAKNAYDVSFMAKFDGNKFPQNVESADVTECYEKLARDKKNIKESAHNDIQECYDGFSTSAIPLVVDMASYKEMFLMELMALKEELNQCRITDDVPSGRAYSCLNNVAMEFERKITEAKKEKKSFVNQDLSVLDLLYFEELVLQRCLSEINFRSNQSVLAIVEETIKCNKLFNDICI